MEVSLAAVRSIEVLKGKAGSASLEIKGLRFGLISTIALDLQH